jgi:hypothetical protein
MPYVIGGAGSVQQVESGLDTGYFFLQQSPPVTPKVGAGAGLCGIGDNTAVARPQWVQLGAGGGTLVDGTDLTPREASPVYRRAYYKTGFVYDAGATRYKFFTPMPPSYPPATVEADVYFWISWPSAGRWYVWHYNPWAWSGTVPEVVASILMACGHDADFIDQTAFDNAYDAFDLSTGDVPYTSAGGTIAGYYWNGMDDKGIIHCSRKVGQKCMELVKECIRHTRDYYFVNEAGKLSVNSYTRPNNVVSGLDLADGIIGRVGREKTLKYTYNKAYHSWGSPVRAYGDPEQTLETSDYSASEEPTLESYIGSLLFSDPGDALGLARYGRIYMNGQNRMVNKGGQPTRINVAHFPFIQNPNTTVEGAGVPSISAFIGVDAQSRKEVEFDQDFRGLDWGVGDEINDVAITGDGETIGVTRCIEREYDFDKLTIRSVLLEIPD